MFPHGRVHSRTVAMATGRPKMRERERQTATKPRYYIRGIEITAISGLGRFGVGGGAAMVLIDPPELKEHKGRVDPPTDSWPGSTVTRQELMAACGDPRDWFRYHHRLQAAEQVWMEFADARRIRRDFSSGFDWNQILILGDYGSKKTTLAIHLALSYFELGHAVFSNASCLFGWRVSREKMYTALGFMPKNSILLIDESSAALASGVGHNVAVSTFGEMNLNIRKQNCIAVYMSAQDWQIAASIRRDCKEVWMPVPNDELDVGEAVRHSKVDAANNPDNFRMAWHVWTDYPYRKANLIEGPDPDDKGGFGPPDHTMYDHGELVRRAFLLNDTFELAQAGAARVADRDAIKDDVRAFLDGTPQREDTPQEDTPQEDTPQEDISLVQVQTEQILMFFQQHEADPPEFFTPGEIGMACGIDSGLVGRRLQSIMRIQNVQRKGYRSADVYKAIYG